MKNASVKNTPGNLYKSYSALRGIDTTGNDKSCFAYLENMYVNYDKNPDSVESIPGYRKIADFKEKVHSMAITTLEAEKSLLVHSKTELFRLSVSKKERVNPLSPIAKIKDGESHIFAFGELCFITDGDALYQVMGNGVKVVNTDKKITMCTVGAIFEERLFLSGNPAFPSRIFYSEKIKDQKIEFLEDSFINASVGSSGVISLLPFGNRLFVFKRENDGEGSILLIKKTVRAFQKEKSISAPSSLSRAIAFDNRIIYLSSEGVMSIDKPMDQDCPTVSCISTPISPLIQPCIGEEAYLGIWSGYGVIALKDKIFLADPRSDKIRWYYINSVGGYKDDRRVFKYSSCPSDEAKAHSNTDMPAGGEIISKETEDKEIIYYSLENGERYSVYPTDEFSGGKFSPASKFVADEGYMYFATEGKGVYLFNKDLEYMPSVDGFKYFYSFDRHSVSYLAITQSEDCGAVCLEKNSLPTSLCLDLKALSEGSLSVSVITDEKVKKEQRIAIVKKEKNESVPIFLNEERIFDLHEGDGTWRKKQIVLESNAYASAFGIKSISFGYRIK